MIQVQKLYRILALRVAVPLELGTIIQRLLCNFIDII